MNPKMSLNSQQYKVLKKIYILLYDILSNYMVNTVSNQYDLCDLKFCQFSNLRLVVA